jgi:hypothetical protein
MVSGGTGPQDDLLPELKNREHAKGERRRQRATILYTDVEWARIVAAAAMAGKRPGAWIAEIAHDAARWRLNGLPAGREVLVELAEQVRSTRNVLANIGGNLNDVAKHANSTHEVASIREQADAVLRMVRRLVSAPTSNWARSRRCCGRDRPRGETVRVAAGRVDRLPVRTGTA